jgi:serine/threonine-protein kinase RsbW
VAAVTKGWTTFRTTLAGAATAEDAVVMREGVARWLHQRGAPRALVLDAVMGVNEALANCVDHAYVEHRRGGAMSVAVDYDCSALSVSVCITDQGTWRAPVPCLPRDTRGRGVALMHALADHCTITGGPDGTTVCLDYRAGTM